jgi:hypothetical protein
MNRREIFLSAGLVFLIALAIRIVAASLVVFPQPEDTAYYVGVARNLLEGQGLTSGALWSYGTPPLSFPRPAFEVWLPLPTFLAAIPMALFGSTFQAAQASSVVVGAIVPVLAWRLGADAATERRLSLSRTRVLALGAGLTSAVYLPLVLHSALPDSTMPFAALAIAACVLMPRILRDAGRVSLANPKVVALGVLIGLAALTRNEAAFVGLAWVVAVWRTPVLERSRKLALIAMPAAVALAIFVPWMVRDWLVFGNPLPGQALSNALSVTGFDIFAWNDPPTMARYLAEGPRRLLLMRAEGLYHNLFTVLLLPGIPAAFLGLIALPFFIRLRAILPLAVLSITTFLVTSLLFPVSTTWGTYLHAAGPAHVLLIVCALLALDAAIERLGQMRGWTRPVAWLGGALTIFGSLLFMAALMPSFGGLSVGLAQRYEALAAQMDAAGMPLEDQGPIITNFPIWLSEATGARALALPAESPRDVIDLASNFEGTSLLILHGDGHGDWPAILDTNAPDADCFDELDIGTPADPKLARALENIRVYRLVCP